jgi:hypothetical protein
VNKIPIYHFASNTRNFPIERFDRHTYSRQLLFRPSARGNPRQGLTPAGSAASPVIPETIFFVIGKIGVPGAENVCYSIIIP